MQHHSFDQDLIDTVSDLIQGTAPDGSFVFVNRAWQEKLGYDQAEIARLKFKDVIHPQYQAHCLELFARVADGEPIGFIEVALVSKHGQIIYLEGSSTLRSGGDGPIALSIFRDISHLKLMELTLWQSEQELGTLLEHIPDSILRINRDHRIIYANAAVEQTTGIPLVHLVGKILKETGLSEDVYVPVQGAVDRIFHTTQTETSELYYTTPSGIRYFHIRLVPEWGAESVESVLVIGRDISERKELEEQLRDLSLTDDLTGLLNRRGFLLHAEQQLKLTRGQRTDGSWLVFADLDGLKQINDGFGHSEGDWTIVQCAGVLKQSFRDSDIVARLSGDEFVVLVLEISQADKDIILNRLIHNLEQCRRNHQKPYLISLSIGSAHISPNHTAELEALIAQADQAMYREKQKRV